MPFTSGVNRFFRTGIVIAVGIALLLGIKATRLALATAVALMALLLLIDAVRLCFAEVRRGEFLSCVLTGTAYGAGIIVLVVTLRSIVDSASYTQPISTRLVGLSLLLLLFVFFAGLLKEGSLSLKDNLLKRKYLLASFNALVLVLAATAVLVGGREVARIFLK
jgi:hypothetical protein